MQIISSVQDGIDFHSMPLTPCATIYTLFRMFLKPKLSLQWKAKRNKFLTACSLFWLQLLSSLRSFSRSIGSKDFNNR